MDINAEAAVLLAEIFKCEVLRDRCPDCTAPLVMIPAQQMPFCVVCTAKRIKAAQDRDILLRARLAARGILVEDCQPVGAMPPPEPTREDDEEFGWPEGVPL